MGGSTLGVGLIGLGTISQGHQAGYQLVRDIAEIVAVCDMRGDLADRRARDLRASAYTEVADLVADPRVDIVDVALPHVLHYPVVKAALEGGKHVLVEKPMALRVAECHELIALAEANGLAFTVAENTRFVQAYVEAERLLAGGALGEIRSVRTFIFGSELKRLKDTELWKGRKDGSGGGAIIDAGPHSFYLLRWLFGDIARLRAFDARLVGESEVEDNAVVAGVLVSKALFTTEYSFTAELPWGERLEIYGSDGALIVDQLRNPPVVLFRGPDDFDGEPVANVLYDPRGWKPASVAAGACDFATGVYEGRPPTVSAEDGLYCVRVAERAYESVAAGGIEIAL